MLYDELTGYIYQLPRALTSVLNVGWLDKGFFQKGPVPSDVLSRLAKIADRYPVHIMRGITPCPICGKEGIPFEYEGVEQGLGNAEVWVPDLKDASKIYAAPNLILHYISDHEYCPPLAFQEAVLGFDLNSQWDGNGVRKKLVTEMFHKYYPDG